MALYNPFHRDILLDSRVIANDAILPFIVHRSVFKYEIFTRFIGTCVLIPPRPPLACRLNDSYRRDHREHDHHHSIRETGNS